MEGGTGEEPTGSDVKVVKKESVAEKSWTLKAGKCKKSIGEAQSLTTVIKIATGSKRPLAGIVMNKM